MFPLTSNKTLRENQHKSKTLFNITEIMLTLTKEREVLRVGNQLPNKQSRLSKFCSRMILNQPRIPLLKLLNRNLSQLLSREFQGYLLVKQQTKNHLNNLNFQLKSIRHNKANLQKSNIRDNKANLQRRNQSKT